VYRDVHSGIRFTRVSSPEREIQLTMPTPKSAYEVLEVSPTATTDELRKGYRRALRRAHPDTGGTAVHFHAVQAAWEQVGTPGDRASYDRRAAARAAAPRTSAPRPSSTSTSSSSSYSSSSSPSFTDPWGRPTPSQSAPRANPRADYPQPPRRDARQDARQNEWPPPPRAEPPPATTRSLGHPGGWWREQYLLAVREWVGAGARVADPFAPKFVASLPLPVRQRLAAAQTEEATARVLATMGVAFTTWHDVATDATGARPDEKLDHVVLGPSGLFAVLSEDRRSPIKIRRGDLTGEGFGWRERPIRTLAQRTAAVSRSAGVRFTALLVVVPDDAGIVGAVSVERSRGLPAIVVTRSALPDLLRSHPASMPPITSEARFAARNHLKRALRFV
jgi:molecular chaperone DnaJ